MKTLLPALLAAGLLAGATAELPSTDLLEEAIVVTPTPGIATGPSFATCSLRFTSGAEADAVSAAAESAALSTAALLCNGTLLEDTANMMETASAIAFASAEAVADVSVECYSSGNSRFSVNGKSIAQARAEAYAEVFVAVTASASVCSPSFNCTAVATFIGEAFERVFASAVAKAEVSLDQNSRETTVMDFAMDVQNSTAEIFALAIADAAASVANGCDIEALGSGSAGDSRVFCAVEVATQDESRSNDAVVKLAAEAVAVAGCNGAAREEFSATAESLAEAIASVIAEVAASCDTAGTGSICVTGEANLTAVVSATATAYAEAFIDARSMCEENFCENPVNLLADAISTVVSRAAADALVEQCAAGGGDVNIMEVTDDIVANATLGIASIILNATVIDGVCNLEVTEFTVGANIVPPPVVTPPPPVVTPPPPVVTPPPPVVTPPPPVVTPPPPVASSCPAGTECVRDNRQCAGVGFEFARPCCSANYLCVRRSNIFSQCRLNGEPGITRWEGSILPCGVASDIPADQL